MKKIFTITILSLFTLSLFSQGISNDRLSKIKAQKIAFITEKLDLTPEEAQVFWPIYNELAQKKEALNKRRKDIAYELNSNWDTYTDKEKEALADEFVGLKLKDANLDIEYHDRFKKVLSIEKVLKLYQAEIAFKNYLLKRIRHQNAQNQQRPPRQRFE